MLSESFKRFLGVSRWIPERFNRFHELRGIYGAFRDISRRSRGPRQLSAGSREFKEFSRGVLSISVGFCPQGRIWMVKVVFRGITVGS